LHQLLAGFGVRVEARFHRGTADHAQARMRADEVEVVNLIAEPVDIRACLHAMAQLELEVEAALAVAVHRTEPDLHHRFGDRARIPVARAVHDLELHCCGIPWPSSPVTAAGTLLGWKYVSRR